MKATKTVKPRAPRMVDLFVRYSRRSEKAFVYDGLTGNVVCGEINMSGKGYDHLVVEILDGNIAVLAIHKEKEYAPQTKIYNETYSDRLDGYMDALERAISELETTNRRRTDEDNRRRKEIRIYENNLF